MSLSRLLFGPNAQTYIQRRQPLLDKYDAGLAAPPQTHLDRQSTLQYMAINGKHSVTLNADGSTDIEDIDRVRDEYIMSKSLLIDEVLPENGGWRRDFTRWAAKNGLIF
jgi:hypothetical protein